MRVRADLTAGVNGRYKEFFTLFNDGTFVQHGQHGIEVFLGRSNSGTNNSGVSVVVDGATIGAQLPSFQFGSALSIDFSYSTDGTLAGKVTGDGNTFDFDFGVVAHPNGGNFMLSTNFIGDPRPTFDNVSLDPLTNSSIPEPTPFSLMEKALFGLFFFKAALSRHYARGSGDHGAGYSAAS